MINRGSPEAINVLLVTECCIIARAKTIRQGIARPGLTMKTGKLALYPFVYLIYLISNSRY